jgi:hypothetical protein
VQRHRKAKHTLKPVLTAISSGGDNVDEGDSSGGDGDRCSSVRCVMEFAAVSVRPTIEPPPHSSPDTAAKQQ